jgi:hypothetical protein
MVPAKQARRPLQVSFSCFSDERRPEFFGMMNNHVYSIFWGGLLTPTPEKEKSTNKLDVTLGVTGACYMIRNL